jgi:hypothetical protein
MENLRVLAKDDPCADASIGLGLRVLTATASVGRSTHRVRSGVAN